MSVRVQNYILIVVACVAAIGCSNADETLVSTRTESPVRIASEHLPNAIRVDERVISGGQPDGELAFKELRELGVKTIVSVDGAKPEVALATKYGMRYVHLPHGYNGISKDRAAQLAKAVRDLPGPIYVHCHHGKHRSPTAAAVACVANGMIEPSAATELLKFAGTSVNYLGLYQSAADARRIDDQLLDSLETEFPEVAELPPFAEAMVELEHTFDHLKRFAHVGWKPLEEHPDLDPSHEALLLREHFAEMLRLESVSKEPSEFRGMLEQSRIDAETLELLLREQSANLNNRKADLDEPFKRLTGNCTACHKQFRDVPLAR